MKARFEPNSVKPPQETDLPDGLEETNQESAKPPQFEEQLLGTQTDNLSVKPPQ